MTIKATSGRTFSSECDLIDVTPMTIIDVNWRCTDPNGHEHAWRVTSTHPPSGDLPTLVRVVDGVGYYEDGDEYEIWHYECLLCRSKVEPRYTSNNRQYHVAGLRHYYIDGEPVSEETFRQESAREGLL